MCSLSILAQCCPEHARLERQFQEARDRMRALVRLRNLSRTEERQLAVRVVMAIARLKEARRGARLPTAGLAGAGPSQAANPRVRSRIAEVAEE